MKFVTSENIPELSGGYLFNDPAFHALKGEPFIAFSLQEGQQGLARIVCYQQGEALVSGYQAPFGSIDSSRLLTESELNAFVAAFIDAFSRKGIRIIIIKSPPGYLPLVNQVEASLFDHGFVETTVELNQHLKIDDQPFTRCISQKERNKLNRALLEGYKPRMLDREQIPAAFQLINTSYSRKNYPVTMNEDGFRVANDHIPGRYLLFGLYDKETLIAVIASVIISEEVLYNFYHADLESYRNRSPLVMLIGETYRYCQEHNIVALDLGISTVEGKINEGLFRFKENLGCEVSEKKTLQLNL